MNTRRRLMRCAAQAAVARPIGAMSNPGGKGAIGPEFNSRGRESAPPVARLAECDAADESESASIQAFLSNAVEESLAAAWKFASPESLETNVGEGSAAA